MKYKIKGQEKEPVVELWLEESAVLSTCSNDGDIILAAKKEGESKEWYICKISSEGLYRYSGIGDDLGFPKDEGNRIKLTFNE